MQRCYYMAVCRNNSERLIWKNSPVLSMLKMSSATYPSQILVQKLNSNLTHISTFSTHFLMENLWHHLNDSFDALKPSTLSVSAYIFACYFIMGPETGRL